EEDSPEKEIADLKDRMLRLAAEFDNYKKRVAKDLNASSDKGKAEIIAKLLPVIDEFELAISNMDIKQEHAKGISLIYSNFISTLKSAGLRALEVSGRYDPYKQEILLAEESNEEDGTILEVVRKGYAFNEIIA
ncbi:GrpE protein, partial [mine drainage metagenome]